MKRKLTKSEYDSLSDDFKKEYEENDGNYLLKIDGKDDAVETAIKRAKEEKAAEKKRADEAEAKLKEAEDEKVKATQEKQRKDGKFDEIEQSYKDRIAALEQEKVDAKAATQKVSDDAMISKAFEGMSSKFVSPSIMKPHIMNRLTVEQVGDTREVRVVDKDGKLTSTSLDDFQKEILADKEFSSMVKASEASGGGAGGSKDTGGASSSKSSSKGLDFLTADPKDVAANLEARRGGE